MTVKPRAWINKMPHPAILLGLPRALAVRLALATPDALGHETVWNCYGGGFWFCQLCSAQHAPLYEGWPVLSERCRGILRYQNAGGQPVWGAA